LLGSGDFLLTPPGRRSYRLGLVMLVEVVAGLE
jgi:hypothetical protein